MTLIEIEEALDRGKLFVKMRSGRNWKARRNGKTQRWKRDVARFRIPIKFGYKDCGEIASCDLPYFDDFFIVL